MQDIPRDGGILTIELVIVSGPESYKVIRLTFLERIVCLIIFCGQFRQRRGCGFCRGMWLLFRDVLRRGGRCFRYDQMIVQGIPADLPVKLRAGHLFVEKRKRGVVQDNALTVERQYFKWVCADMNLCAKRKNIIRAFPVRFRSAGENSAGLLLLRKTLGAFGLLLLEGRQTLFFFPGQVSFYSNQLTDALGHLWPRQQQVFIRPDVFTAFQRNTLTVVHFVDVRPRQHRVAATDAVFMLDKFNIFL